jgi:hypothetical protein
LQTPGKCWLARAVLLRIDNDQLDRMPPIVNLMQSITDLDLTDGSLVGSIPCCAGRLFGSRKKGAIENEAH